MEKKQFVQKHDEKALTLFENYLQAAQPVIRDAKGRLMYKNWTLTPIMYYVHNNAECMEKLVFKHTDTLKNIGAELAYQELGAQHYYNLVGSLYRMDLEMAVEFAKYLPAESSLFKEITEKAIGQDLDISPIIDMLYAEAPELYHSFMNSQKNRPTPEGLKTMLKFFPELISRSHDKRAERLEFSKWLDILEKYLQNRPHETNFLLAGYNRFKDKNEGPSAYLLKDVVTQYAPNLFEPVHITHNCFFDM